MKTKNLKGVAAGLAAVMAAACVTGCGGGSKSGDLTIYTGVGANITAAGGETFNDCLTFQLLEEKTGKHVEWIHPAAGTGAEQFNLMMTSGEYPDAIVYNWANATGGTASYVEDGVIVDLTDYIYPTDGSESCMPNLKKIMDENPDIRRDIVTDDGRIYVIPYLRLDEALCVFQGPVIRQDWLDKLGLKAPTTPDELYTVLKAFKTQDPNGNGQADEIPMGGTGGFDNVAGVGPLLWAFGANYDFQVKDGKVVYGPTTKEFKEGLEYIAKLYSEGLIDMDYLQDTRSKLDAKFTGDLAGFKFGFQPTTYYDTMNDGTKKVAGIGYLKAADGENYCFNPAYTQPVLQGVALAVTTNNEDPAGTLKWLDELYGGEGLNYANYGKEGDTYTLVDGEPVFTDKVLKPDNGKTSANMIALTAAVRDSAFPMGQTWQFYKQTLAPWGIEAVENWLADDANTDGIVPPITKTAEENERYSSIMNTVKTYMQEEANKVITGRASVNDWDKVIAQIKTMGIDEATEIQNAAYQRYLAR